MQGSRVTLSRLLLSGTSLYRDEKVADFGLCFSQETLTLVITKLPQAFIKLAKTLILELLRSQTVFLSIFFLEISIEF
jgi:hypothetical protein